MLKVSGVTKRFGGLTALADVNLSIKEREIVGLIGPNGAGKTTLINCITGVLPLTSGKIEFMDLDISHLKPHQIWKLGIARTFQIPRPFGNMSVLKNVMVGAKSSETTLRVLNYVGLKDKKDLLAKKLTFIEKRMLGLATSLASEPKLLLIDECAAGLNPSEIVDLMKLIKNILKDYNCAIMWVEHVMKAIMGTVDRVVVLNFGKKIADGSVKSIAESKEVIEAYLGEKYAL